MSEYPKKGQFVITNVALIMHKIFSRHRFPWFTLRASSFFSLLSPFKTHFLAVRDGDESWVCSTEGRLKFVWLLLFSVKGDADARRYRQFFLSSHLGFVEGHIKSDSQE